MSDMAAGSPTVTIFADRGPLVAELSAEIVARGASIHSISIEAGWLASTSRALLALDSLAGRSAIEGLCESEYSGAHVVALVTEGRGPGASEACDRCAERHDVTVLNLADDDLANKVADAVVGIPILS